MSLLYHPSDLVWLGRVGLQDDPLRTSVVNHRERLLCRRVILEVVNGDARPPSAIFSAIPRLILRELPVPRRTSPSGTSLPPSWPEHFVESAVQWIRVKHLISVIVGSWQNTRSRNC